MQRQRTVPCEPALRSRRLSFASQAAASCIARRLIVAFGRPLLGEGEGPISAVDTFRHPNNFTRVLIVDHLHLYTPIHTYTHTHTTSRHHGHHVPHLFFQPARLARLLRLRGRAGHGRLAYVKSRVAQTFLEPTADAAVHNRRPRCPTQPAVSAHRHQCRLLSRWSSDARQRRRWERVSKAGPAHVLARHGITTPHAAPTELAHAVQLVTCARHFQAGQDD